MDQITFFGPSSDELDPNLKRPQKRYLIIYLANLHTILRGF